MEHVARVTVAPLLRTGKLQGAVYVYVQVHAQSVMWCGDRARTMSGPVEVEV